MDLGNFEVKISESNKRMTWKKWKNLRIIIFFEEVMINQDWLVL